MTAEDIAREIISGNMTNSQLNMIIQAVTFARNQIIRRNTGTLVLGSKVKFVNSRNGQTVLGVVEKVNRKFIIVRSGPSSWRVPASMLEAA